ncbi:MAG: hypothetical protein B6D59_02880 [Campylobacteraceae bacterium 4484_4]|nr:MAG: hypothetical protein B6D59_02880 [Campylobacteraceae bacterium 4484_4]
MTEALIEALEEDNLLKVKQLIKQGANLNEETEEEASLLFYAFRKKCSPELIRLMIESGADLSITSPLGISVLDEAIALGDLELIKYLVLEKGFDVNRTRRKSGVTPLMIASSYGYEEIVSFLLEQGAELTALDKLGMSALDYSKRLGKKRMYQYLQQYRSSGKSGE